MSKQGTIKVDATVEEDGIVTNISINNASAGAALFVAARIIVSMSKDMEEDLEDTLLTVSDYSKRIKRDDEKQAELQKSE